MAYSEGTGSPSILFDVEALAKAFSNYALAHSITTQAQWTAHVNGLTTADPNFLTLVLGFLRNAPKGLP